MELVTLSYNAESGWSAPFPNWDSAQTLVIVFGASQFIDRPQPIQMLAEAYPTAHMIGCSTSGEIHGLTIADDSLSVAVMRFAATDLQSVMMPLQNMDASRSLGADLARQLLRPDLKGVLIFSDGISVNGTQLIDGINSVLPPSVVITGGLAGDGPRFERTWIIKDRQPHTGYVSAIGLYGEHITLQHGSKGGWDRFGPEYLITKSSNNILREIAHQPALKIYKQYLKERAADLPASALLFPLALRASATDAKQIVRTVLGVDEAQQSMTFAGDMPEGYLAQFMRADFDRLIQGAAGAALMTRANTTSATAMLILAISCVGRRLVLKERAPEELQAVFDVLPKSAKQIGFYSYGELSPYASGACDLHNQTMTLTVISEQ
jgi:hypothetical protein